MTSKSMIITEKQRPKATQWFFLSFQHIFAMFGATVLVPAITGLEVSVALIASGIGTLLYILCTKGKVPVYLGSSFAFLGVITMARKPLIGGGFDFSAVYIGVIVVGIINLIVAGYIKLFGTKWINKVLPPVVMGPMIAIIGLCLAGNAIEMAGLSSTNTDIRLPIVALITFGVTVFTALKAKGFLRIIPFIIGLAAGYVSAILLGLIGDTSIIDYTKITQASFLALPKFHFIGTYKPDFSAVLMFAPIAFVTICEHIGDHIVLGKITGQDYINNPGLHRTIMGDGVATIAAGAIGFSDTTTYGENISVVALTKVSSVWVTGLAAVIAIFLGFIGYVQGFITSIPGCVMGGISIVLFGMIAANGLKILKTDNVDFNTRNIIIIATMLIVGLGGAVIKFTDTFSLDKMALSAVIGIILNLVLPKEKEETIGEE